MASESEKTSESEKEITDIEQECTVSDIQKSVNIKKCAIRTLDINEIMSGKNSIGEISDDFNTALMHPCERDICVRKQDLSDEKKIVENVKENTEIELTANPKREDRKRSKACGEDPYIVKLFKSLMNQENQENFEKKKK